MHGTARQNRAPKQGDPEAQLLLGKRVLKSNEVEVCTIRFSGLLFLIPTSLPFGPPNLSEGNFAPARFRPSHFRITLVTFEPVPGVLP